MQSHARLQRAGGERRAMILAAVIVVVLAIVLVAALRGRGGDAPAVDSSEPIAEVSPPTGPVADIRVDSEPSMPQPESAISEAPAATPGGGEIADAHTPSELGKVLRGQVVDKDSGAPIAGALVEQCSTNFPLGGLSTSIVSSITTGEDGRYELPLETDSRPSPWGIMPFVYIRAGADAHETSLVVVPNTLVDGEKDVDFRLGAGGEITGRVVNVAGAAVAGAIVGHAMMVTPGGFRGDDVSPPVVSSLAETDSDGKFVLKGIPLDFKTRIPVRADGYIPMVTDKEYTAGDRNVEIVLTRGSARLYGKVLDENEAPVAGAMVFATVVQTGPMEWLDITTRNASATADSMGAFSFDGLNPGPYMLHAVANVSHRGAPGRSVNKSIIIAEDQEQEVILRLPGKTRISGIVVDDQTNAPIPGVRISDMPYGNSGVPVSDAPRQEVISNFDGRFGLDVYSSGSQVVVYIQPIPGYVLDNRSYPRGSERLSITEGATEATITVRLKKGVTVSGLVVQADETTPAPDATVTYYSSFGMGGIEVKADPQGRFTFDVVPGREYEFTAAHEEYGAGRATAFVETTKESQDVVIVLGELASIDGYVHNEDGDPVEGVRLNISISFLGGRMRTMMSPSDLARTNADGYYYVPDIAPGELRVSAAPPPESGYSTSEEQTLNLKPGEYRRDVDFVLVKGEPLEGTVIDEDGNPVAGASVYPQINNSMIPHQQQVTTDAEGKFKVVGLDPDVVIDYLNISHQDYYHAFQQNVTVDDSPVTITLTKKKSVELTVVQSGTNAPVAHYLYEIRTSQWNQQEQVSYQHNGITVNSPDGKTSIIQLPEGDNTIYVVALDDSGKPTGLKGTAKLMVEKTAEPGSVTIQVSGGRRITGTVVMDADDRPVAGATVGIRKPQVNPWGGPTGNAAFDIANTTTDSAGRFTLDGVVAGSHALEATFESMIMKSDVAVTVSSDRDPEPVEIRLIGAGAIYGVVTGFDGQPLTGAFIDHHFFGNQPSYEGPKRYSLDEEGRYRIDNLEQGYHNITLNLGDGDDGRQQGVQLAAGEEKEINFDLSSAVLLTGVITINGESVKNAHDLIFYPTNGDGGMVRPIMTGEGNYSARLIPGIWVLQANLSNQFQTVETFTLEASPREQQRDFHIVVNPVSIVVVFPTDDDTVDGRVSLSSDDQAGPAEWVGQTYPVRAPDPVHHIGHLDPGVYTATFRSDDGEWQGKSMPTEVGEGLENILVVEPRPSSQRILVATWSPADMYPEVTPMTIDITPHVRAPGTFEVTLDYTSGNDAAEFEFVAVRINGSEVSRDAHPGWSGFTRRDHIYTVEIPAFQSGARVTLEVGIKGQKDSNGNVFLANL